LNSEHDEITPEVLICACCGQEITEDYYVVGDNFLQAKFFDSEEDNRFCSKDCLCASLSTLLVDKETGDVFPVSGG